MTETELSVFFFAPGNRGIVFKGGKNMLDYEYQYDECGNDGLINKTSIYFRSEAEKEFFEEFMWELESITAGWCDIDYDYWTENDCAFAEYACTLYELPNGDGWERSEFPVDAIKVSREGSLCEVSFVLQEVYQMTDSRGWQETMRLVRNILTSARIIR